MISIAGKRNKRVSRDSDTSTISSTEMNNLLDQIKFNKNKDSTSRIYHNVWVNFNRFLVRLDELPSTWEKRVSLYCAHLLKRGAKSATLKSYVSAIKGFLVADGYPWDQNQILLDVLTKSCSLQNDEVYNRLPIQLGLLELLLIETQKLYDGTQPYLELLYKTLFSFMYYGLMRVGEVAKTEDARHTLKAKDVHVADNKKKIQLILYSSKTHDRRHRPQQIKITANEFYHAHNMARGPHFCPFVLANNYCESRGDYEHDEDQYFIFRDGAPVTARHVRVMLRRLLTRLNLEPHLYDTHSFRIGRATDLMKLHADIEKIKLTGRWRSNAVYKYIRDM